MTTSDLRTVANFLDRLADAPPSRRLGAIAEAERQLAAARRDLVVEMMLDPIGKWTWGDVGRILDVSRQAARQAYGRTVNAHAHLREDLRKREARRAAGEPEVELGDVATMPLTDERVVVIPCGGAKVDHLAPAGEMYVGSYHQACRRAADTLVGEATLAGKPARVLILSAKYGLVALDRVIAPYDVKMGERGSVSVDTLRRQARELGVDRAGDVTVLAGRRYAHAVSMVWPYAKRPLDGCGGIGEQLAVLRAMVR